MKYIVIDVDGVLNSFSETEDSFWTTGYAQGNPFPLCLNKNHGQWLLELAEDTGAQLIWGTTWTTDANSQVGAQIGLPELTVPDFGQQGFRQSNAAWKAFGILAFVGDNPFVWFDDDYEISYYLASTSGHHIRVDSNKGLTEAHIERARTILKQGK